MENFNQSYNELILEYSNEDLISFIEKRKAGAEKIEKSSKEKGGVAKLTAIHFAAKREPYKKALSMVEKENCSDALKDKCEELLSKLKYWNNMSQKEFQHVMGELEAYGEVYIRTVKPNSINLK